MDYHAAFGEVVVEHGLYPYYSAANIGQSKHYFDFFVVGGIGEDDFVLEFFRKAVYYFRGGFFCVYGAEFQVIAFVLGGEYAIVYGIVFGSFLFLDFFSFFFFLVFVFLVILPMIPVAAEVADLTAGLAAAAFGTAVAGFFILNAGFGVSPAGFCPLATGFCPLAA